MQKIKTQTQEQLLKEIDILKIKIDELEKNREISLLITENTGDIIALTTFDLESKYLFISDSVQNVLGYEPKDLLGKSFFDFIHPDDKSGLSLVLKKFIKLKSSRLSKLSGPQTARTIEFRFKSKAGTWHYMESTLNILGSDLLAITRDITQRKLSDEALIASEKKFSSIVESSPMGMHIYSLEADGKLIFRGANPAADVLLGVDNSQLVGKTIEEAFPPLSDIEIPERYREVASDGKRWQTEQLVYDDGKISGAFEVHAFQTLPDNMVAVFMDITERKKTEKALRESENNLRALFNAMSDLVFELDYNGRYISIAPTSPELMFKPSEEIIGKTLHEVFPKPEADVFLKFIRNSLNDNKIKTIEYPLNINNKITWFEGKAYPKSKNTVLFIARDITERKQAENLLIKSEKKYKDLFEKSQDAILILHNNKFVDCNQATINMLRYYSKESFLNTHPSELSPERQPDGKKSFSKANEMINIAMKNGSNRFEWLHKKSNGEVFPVEVLLTAISTEPENQIIHTVWRDITERKKAELALKESEGKYRKLVETSSEGFWLIDKEKKTIDVNQALCNMIGYSRKELIGRNPAEFTNDDNRKIFNEQVKISRNTKQRTYEMSFIRKDETNLPTICSATSILNQSGKDSGSFAFITDTTKLKRVESDLKKALKKATESDRLKSAFLANMSHEIRTPMNGILGFADLLKEPDITSEDLKYYTSVIEQSGIRMLKIINDLIDISKVEAGQMTINISEVNINSQIEYLYKFFKPEVEKKGMSFSFNNSLPEMKSIIKTDKEKIYSILTNLIKNAIKYSHEGSIEYGYILKAEAKFPKLEFYIKDTGIGIPKNRQKAIFDRFIQADIDDKDAYEGSGLGLSIAKAYVEMLGGKIWVESEEGVGSKFCFTIPYNAVIKEIAFPESNQDMDENQKSAIEIKFQNNKLKILIADDEDFAFKHLSIVLKNISKEIFHAKTGIQAIELFENNPDIDLVLMDIKMPIMDGYDAARKIRKINNDVIMIAQTAFAQKNDRMKVIDAGCNDYISKPINKIKLLEMIESYCGGS